MGSNNRSCCWHRTLEDLRRFYLWNCLFAGCSVHRGLPNIRRCLRKPKTGGCAFLVHLDGFVRLRIVRYQKVDFGRCSLATDIYNHRNHYGFTGRCQAAIVKGNRLCPIRFVWSGFFIVKIKSRWKHIKLWKTEGKKRKEKGYYGFFTRVKKPYIDCFLCYNKNRIK